MRNSIAIIITVALTAASAAAREPLRHVNDILAAQDTKSTGIPFDVTAMVTLAGKPGVLGFIAEDDTGASYFGTNPAIAFDCPTNAGDIVRLQGLTIHTSGGTVAADCHKIERIAHRGKPEAHFVSAKALQINSKLRNRLARATGVIYDIMRDDIDPRWIFVLLCCNDGIVYWTAYDEDTPVEKLDWMIGLHATADGIVTRHNMTRTTIGNILLSHDITALKTLEPAFSDPYDVPAATKAASPLYAKPASVARKRTSGHVIAVWNGGDNILIKSQDGDLHRVDLRHGPPPRYGDSVKVVGYTETDLYRINFTHASWSKDNGAPMQMPTAEDVSADEIFTDSWLQPARGRHQKNMQMLGRAVRIRGLVRGISSAGRDIGRLYLESGSFILMVDASGCPEALDELDVGCIVEVSGTYIATADSLSGTRIFPMVKDVLIAVRRPQDVKVLSRPSWWTPGRMFVLAGALLAVLLGIFAWNMALRRKAERRGRELADEQLAHVASELKVVERTRLAVELHDSLSQTLTGISLGIDSALDIAGDASEELKRQLNYTSKTVEACRTELRNCLWDLRSQALEESDMNAAIQLALSQIVSKTALNVRFAVPRTRLSDKTTHTILRIIRELATNAVRHGHASSIKIAGCIDGGKLRFSVADNGTGFDPDHAAGVAEGHFGLEGIRERVDRLDGEVDISSSPGRGTKVTVAFDIPPAKMEEGHGNG